MRTSVFNRKVSLLMAVQLTFSGFVSIGSTTSQTFLPYKHKKGKCYLTISLTLYKYCVTIFIQKFT